LAADEAVRRPATVSANLGEAFVHTTSVANVREAGFGLLATFGRPHYTLILPDTSPSTLGRLAAALGPATANNPYLVTRRRR
jgi:hypothetical protein